MDTNGFKNATYRLQWKLHYSIFQINAVSIAVRTLLMLSVHTCMMCLMHVKTFSAVQLIFNYYKMLTIKISVI